MPQRRSGCLITSAITVLILAGVLIALFTIATSRGRTVRDRIAEMEQRGVPVTLAELNRFYAVPDGENAAPLLLQAAQSADIDETRMLVARAAETGVARFNVDYVNFKTNPPRHYSDLRQLVRLLQGDAITRSASGDSIGAVESLRLAFAVVELHGTEPSLIAHVVRVAMMEICLGGFSSVVGAAELSADEIETLRSAIVNAYSGESVQRAFIGERAFTLSPGGPFDANFALYMLDWPYLLDLYETLIDSADDPLRDTVSVLDEYSTPQRQPKRKLIHPYARIIAPPLLSVMEGHVRVATRQQLALLVCAIEAYHRKHDALPASLEAAGIDAPNDPYTAAPLQFRRIENGYVVYSVGPDRVDHKGDLDAIWQPGGNKPKDIAIAVPTDDRRLNIDSRNTP